MVMLVQVSMGMSVQKYSNKLGKLVALLKQY